MAGAVILGNVQLPFVGEYHPTPVDEANDTGLY